MQTHTEFREIPGKFDWEFRMFFKKFRIPPEVKKSTSVDTLTTGYATVIPALGQRFPKKCAKLSGKKVHV
jgi:hypothetical protein